jgi:hypothetical protein
MPLVPSLADHITLPVKVHMRKRHGAPPAEPRNGSPIRAEFEEE